MLWAATCCNIVSINACIFCYHIFSYHCVKQMFLHLISIIPSPGVLAGVPQEPAVPGAAAVRGRVRVQAVPHLLSAG